jgi:hypothetical protein
MKKYCYLILLTLFICVGTIRHSFAQHGCMLVPLDPTDLSSKSSLVVEGEVISQNSVYNESQNFIYTVSQLRLYKVFKGNPGGSVISIITQGGTIGLQKIQVSSENEFFVGEKGVFFLEPSTARLSNLNFTGSSFEVVAAEQGVFVYRENESVAMNPYMEVKNIPSGMYDFLQRIGLSASPTIIQPWPSNGGNVSNPKNNTPGLLTVPTITSFTPTTITAGTRSILTINGSGFGATRGTGFVEFRDANNSGVTAWVQPKANDYKVWNNTQIQVYVPSSSLGPNASAGTGQIRVTNSTASPNQATSAGTLTVSYSAINVEFNSTGFYTEHANDNGAGGYTFQYHSTEFSNNAAATAAFVRAMNTWTCATNMNWSVGAVSTIDVVAADNVNIVRFDNGAELPVNVLGRATSYFSGCSTVGGDTVWQVTEIDMAMDDGTVWEFGPALPSVTEVDFETVVLHELGHGHQLDHVINTSAVMHASVSAGVAKRTLLVASDEAGGDFKMTQAVATHGGCKPIANVMTALNIGGSVSIAASPGTTICSGTSVTFTATASVPVGTVAYQWKKNGANVGTNLATYTDAGLTNGNTIQCVVTVTGGCGLILNSNTLTMSVTSAVAPTVSIAANPGNSICAGTSVTFTATPTNGGTTPAYQWKVNGTNVGTNSATFTTTTLTNGQIVTCVLTSNATCASPTTATSNAITMTVNPSVVPSVSISANPGSTICAGASVTFTAVPTNGGVTPAYQWKVNGANVGTNNATFTTTTLTNGQIVTCVLTSNATCAIPASVTSNSITMTVNSVVVPSVSIVANPGSTICTGTSVTFTATPTNGGVTPAYQWKVNGTNAGTNSATFTTTTLTNGQIVTCVLTSNATCASPTTATSNAITMTVNPSVVPSVSISANPGSTICAGTSVTFTATPTNGGTTPAYQWKINGGNVGTNSTTFTTTSLTNGQIVTCVLTSNATCASPTTATSNAITMTVNPLLTPSVSIAANPGSTICAGSSVTFTATPTNGGTTPAYQWKVNGGNVGTNSPTFTTTTLTNGQIVTCVLTSNAVCASPTTATSNAITMTVNPVVVPTISISANPGSTVCNGTNVTFTAVITNGGTTPVFQWKRNGSAVGTNSPTYSSNTFLTGEEVSCVFVSNALCASPASENSNTITMTVNPVLTPSVSISASTGTTICAGTSVTFTATPTNGGTTPSYQWKVNGANVGTNSTTFTTTTLTNGQIVTCVLTSNAVCASPTTATSNALTMTVNPLLTPAVSIATLSSNIICSGTSVTFTATPSNGGTTPAYQWKVNGVNAGTNSATFTTTTLTTGQAVTCVLTSNATCASPTTATSNAITRTVVAGVPLITSVTPSSGPVGTSIVIRGTRLATATQVQIGSGSTTSMIVSGDTMITTTVPAGSTTGIVRVTNVCGQNTTGVTYTVTSSSVTLNLGLFIEGFYIGSNTMSPVLFNSGASSNPLACDSITIELHNTTNPYATAHTVNGLLLTNGTCQVTFPGSALGNSYYIVVNHRNTIETWSKLPVLMSSNTSYTFKQ